MIVYVWFISWSFRQAVRASLNGYDYGEVAKMGYEAVREFKWKRRRPKK